MDRTKQIAAMAETEEERLLLTRLCERMERTQQRDIPRIDLLSFSKRAGSGA